MFGIFESFFQSTTIPASVLKNLRDGTYFYQSQKEKHYRRTVASSREHLHGHQIEGAVLNLHNPTYRDMLMLGSVISKNRIIELNLHGPLTTAGIHTLMQSMQCTSKHSLQTQTTSSSQKYVLFGTNTLNLNIQAPTSNDIQAKTKYAKEVFDFMSMILLELIAREWYPSETQKIHISPPDDLGAHYGMGALIALGVDYDAIQLDMTNVYDRNNFPRPDYFSSKGKNRKIDVHGHNSIHIRELIEALIGRENTSQPIPKHLLSKAAEWSKYGYRTQFDIKMIADRICHIETIRTANVLVDIYNENRYGEQKYYKNKAQIIYGNSLQVTTEDLSIITNRLRNRWLPLRVTFHDNDLTSEQLAIISQWVPNSAIDELYIFEANKKVENNPQVSRINDLVSQNQKNLDMEIASIQKIALPFSMVTLRQAENPNIVELNQNPSDDIPDEMREAPRSVSEISDIPASSSNSKLTTSINDFQSPTVAHQRPDMGWKDNGATQLQSKPSRVNFLDKYRSEIRSSEDLFATPNVISSESKYTGTYVSRKRVSAGVLFKQQQADSIFTTPKQSSISNSGEKDHGMNQPQPKFERVNFLDKYRSEIRSSEDLFATPNVISSESKYTGAYVSRKRVPASEMFKQNSNLGNSGGTSALKCTQDNPEIVVMKTEDLFISRETFEKLTRQLENSEKHYTISLEVLDEKINACKQQLMPSSVFSTEDVEGLQAHLAKYREKEKLLLERREISLNLEWDTYYRAIQQHFSGLMVASLGVGTGYVPVSESKKAKAFKYVASAIGFAFPTHHVSVITSVASDTVNFLDAQARKKFLAKINVFGNNLTEADILGEKVARLLLRARVYVGDKICSEQADKDSETLIKVILQVSEPIARDEDTASILVEMILGYKPHCNHLPLTVAAIPPPDSTFSPAETRRSIDSEHSTLARFETEFSDLRDKLHDIQERTKDTPSQATVSELVRQMQSMQKTVNRLQASDGLETVLSSNSSQPQAQLLVKRGDSTRSENFQDEFDKKDQQIALLEEQMQVMAQQLVRLEEHLLAMVQQSPMAENEKKGIVDDISASNRASDRTKQKTHQRTKDSLFGHSVPASFHVKNQDLGTEKTKKKNGLDQKNKLQWCIKSALLDATSGYIRFCDMQRGITNHGGTASRSECQKLNLLAEQALAQQLSQLIQRFNSHTSSSKMGIYSLDMFIVNSLIQKSSQVPLLQTRIGTISLSASDKSAIKIPRPSFGIYPDSTIVANCLKREEIRQALIVIQQELITDCSVTETANLDF